MSTAARVRRQSAGSESTPRCPICTGREVDWEFFAKGIPKSAGRFQVVRCRACGLAWTEPRLPDREIGRWYPAVYYGKDNVRFHWTLETLVRLFRRRRSALIRRRTRPGPVLDVGCGRGRILGTLKKFGYQPFGVEISEHAAWHARHRMGAKVHVGDFLDASFRKGSFHAVIFWHSLEHLSRPIEALRRAHELLAPGGLLVVAAPNSESLQAGLTGRNWFHLDVPRHYFHFGARSLRRALVENGFRIAESAHFSFEQNPYGWLQSLTNMLGFEFNFLYDWLKSGSPRLVPIRRHPLQALGILLMLPLLVPLSIALTMLEAALRRGGTVEFYAVKR